MKNRFAVYLVLVLSSFLTGAVLAEGALRLGQASIAGDTVTIPVTLQGDVGTGVSAIGFELNYDPSVFEPVAAQPGTAATTADKDVQANMTEPGSYRVLMVGFNTNTLTDGEVARITLSRVGDPPSGRSEVRISNTSMSTADPVMEIPSTGSTGAIAFTDVPSEDPVDDEPGDRPSSANDRDESTQRRTTPDQQSQNSEEQPVVATEADPNETGAPASQDEGQRIVTGRLPVTDVDSGVGEHGVSTTRSGTGTPTSRRQSTTRGEASTSVGSGAKRLSSAVSAADAVRAGIRTPGSPLSMDTEATPDTGAPQTAESDVNESVASEQLAKGAEKTGTAADKTLAAVSPSAEPGLAAPVGIAADAPPTKQTSDKAETKGRALKIAIVGALVVLVVAVFFVRKRLFA